MKKLSFRENLGFGSGSLGDSVGYNFIGTFLMFFLTTVAGVEPVAAGTLSAIGAVWNALCNPVIGYISDRVRTRFGRRRPMIFLFSIPLAISMLLLFTAVEIPYGLRPVYYGGMLMIFWTCYTGFFVPYSALGVEYTSDYNERTVLRSFASFFNMIGSMITMAVPTAFVELLTGRGMSVENAWSAAGGLLGGVTMISIMITALVSASKDPACKPTEEEKRAAAREKFDILGIFREYVSITRLKPMKYLIIASLCALVGYTMIMSDIVYFLTYNQGLSSSEASLCLMARSGFCIILLPIVNKAVMVTDKRETLIGAYILGSAGMILVKLAGIESMGGILVYIALTAVCGSVYWQIMPSVFYDVCEYDRAETGLDRQGAIVSFQGLVEAIAAGGGSQLLGIILQMAGFDGEASSQSSGALNWIENSTTWIPVIFFLISSAALLKYPITRKKYQELLERRENS